MSLIGGCGQDNMFACDDQGTPSHCVEQSDDEKAMAALEDNDLDTAETILERLIGEEPRQYFRYPRLAAVYARQAGFDLLTATSAGSQGGDFLDQVAVFLPDPKVVPSAAYDGFVDKMEQAKQTLQAMPGAERIAGEKFYGASASFQLTLYSSALSVMLLNKFTPSGDALADQQRLESLTIEDAAEIISSLKDAAVTSAQDDPEVSAKINGILAEVDQQEGDDDQERLRSYLEARE